MIRFAGTREGYPSTRNLVGHMLGLRAFANIGAHLVEAIEREGDLHGVRRLQSAAVHRCLPLHEPNIGWSAPLGGFGRRHDIRVEEELSLDTLLADLDSVKDYAGVRVTSPFR